jgi:hypothetical protein
LPPGSVVATDGKLLRESGVRGLRLVDGGGKLVGDLSRFVVYSLQSATNGTERQHAIDVACVLVNEQAQLGQRLRMASVDKDVVLADG